MSEYITHIGVDESGKGDFFGPLVIAGVMVDEKTAEKFAALGIKDSKKITDKKILTLEPIIKESAPHTVVAISNGRYNEMYASIKNLNKLLAWGHARTIENILEKNDCSYAISDKFGGFGFGSCSFRSQNRTNAKFVRNYVSERLCRSS